LSDLLVNPALKRTQDVAVTLVWLWEIVMALNLEEYSNTRRQDLQQIVMRLTSFSFSQHEKAPEANRIVHYVQKVAKLI